MNQVTVKPALLRWAQERSRVDAQKLIQRFPGLEQWKRGKGGPTLHQLEAFSRATHTPIGFFFLRNPPEDKVPIPDFRTMAGTAVGGPSPDLLETVYLCQERQEWYRDYARAMGEKPLRFVGSIRLSEGEVSAARKIRDALELDLEERRQFPTWTDALRAFMDRAEGLGVLVMTNSVVGNNNHRRLSPEEFRGFALSDDLAPLVFMNGADSRSAQMFTLAHELAHLWLGKSALSNSDPQGTPEHQVEKWCNRVAAELLLPLAALKSRFDKGPALEDEMKRLSREFKVSTLVVLRRVLDAGLIGRREFREAYDRELTRLKDVQKQGGGDFYGMQLRRVGRRFAHAVISNTLEGQTLHRDACRLLSISKTSTFNKLGKALGVE